MCIRDRLGIVFAPADDRGDVGVQIQKRKLLVNYKRLQLKVAASQMYPEDYDFSIIFDTVENRKARHQIDVYKRQDDDGIFIWTSGKKKEAETCSGPYLQENAGNGYLCIACPDRAFSLFSCFAAVIRFHNRRL